METIMRFDENLNMFKNLVLLYKNDKGETFIGSSTYNKNEKDNNKSHIVLYKDCLPEDKNYIMGWNYLDDHCEKIYLVNNQYSEVAVDDFLNAHHIDKTWKDISYTVVDSIAQINEILSTAKLANNEIKAYATLH